MGQAAAAAAAPFPASFRSMVSLRSRSFRSPSALVALEARQAPGALSRQAPPEVTAETRISQAWRSSTALRAAEAEAQLAQEAATT
jgi:hypothetical protein